MQNTEWFGLNDGKKLFFLSQISLYPRELSAEEFKSSPLKYVENTKEKQRDIYFAFDVFFKKYISESNKVIWSNQTYNYKREGYEGGEILDFLTETTLECYIDRQNKIIFALDHYMEILVFSHARFNLQDIDGLYQRTSNQPIHWHQTQWA